jgi:glucose uptake protein GlcU
MPDKKSNRILTALREIDGLVLAFIGFIILYAFSAYGYTISFIWNVLIVIVIIVIVGIYYLYKKRGRKGF